MYKIIYIQYDNESLHKQYYYYYQYNLCGNNFGGLGETPSGLVTLGIESSRSNISLFAVEGGADGTVSSSPTPNGKLNRFP